MWSWSSHRYRRLVKKVELELRASAAERKPKVRKRLERLRERLAYAVGRERREINPKYCELCNGRLMFPESYERGQCAECRDEEE